MNISRAKSQNEDAVHHIKDCYSGSVVRQVRVIFSNSKVLHNFQTYLASEDEVNVRFLPPFIVGEVSIEHFVSVLQMVQRTDISKFA